MHVNIGTIEIYRREPATGEEFLLHFGAALPARLTRELGRLLINNGAAPPALEPDGSLWLLVTDLKAEASHG